MSSNGIFWVKKQARAFSEHDIESAMSHIAKIAVNPYQASLTLGVAPYHVHRLIRHRIITPTLAHALAKAGVVEERATIEIDACPHCGKAHIAKGCPTNRKPDGRNRATVNLDKPELIAKVLFNRMTAEAINELIYELGWRIEHE